MKLRLLTLMIMASLGTVGCGDSSQDGGSSSSSVSASGVAVDGLILNGQVSIDLNGNGILDPFEPVAETDDSGFYSISTSISAADFTVRVNGGVDSLTGEAFEGEMEASVARPENGVVVTNITPVTSLISSVQRSIQINKNDVTSISDAINQAEARVAALLNIPQEKVNNNPLEDGVVDKELLSAGVKLHHFTKTLSQVVDTHFSGSVGEDDDVPSSSQKLTYDSLAEVLRTADTVDQSILESEETARQLISETNRRMREAIERVNAVREASEAVVLPTVQDIDATKVQTIATEIAKIPAVVENLINKDGETLDLEEAAGRSKVVEVVSQKIRNEAKKETVNVTEIQRITESVTTTETDAGNADVQIRQKLIDTLSDENAKLEDLVETDIIGDKTTEQIINEIEEKGKVPVGTSRFVKADMAGLELRVFDPDKGSDGQKDNAGIFFFQPNGQLQACVKFVDGLDSNGDVTGDGNTKGKLTGGSWSVPGDSSLTMSMVVDVDGIRYNLIVKSLGVSSTDGTIYNYRFKYLDESQVWNSRTNLQSTASVTGDLPTDDATCRTMLSDNM